MTATAPSSYRPNQLIQTDLATSVWADLPSLLRHPITGLSPMQKQMLTALNVKVKKPVESPNFPYWSKQNRIIGYDATASILTCSAHAISYYDCIHCGFPDSNNGQIFSFKCNNRWFCPHCNYRRYGAPLAWEYGQGSSPDPDRFYFVISLSSNPDEASRLVFETGTSSDPSSVANRNGWPDRDPSDYGILFGGGNTILECRVYLEIVHAAVREFTGPGKIFSGSVLLPEISLRFLPLGILPHVNVVVWSPHLSKEDVRAIRSVIRQKMLNSRHRPEGLYPYVAAYRIPSTEDMRSILKYSVKPIDLGSPYLHAANLNQNVPAELRKLNIEANDFLAALPIIFRGFRRIYRLGTCSSRSKGYIGAVSTLKFSQLERAKRRREEKVREDEHWRNYFGSPHPQKKHRPTPERRRLTQLANIIDEIELGVRTRLPRFGRGLGAVAQTSPALPSSPVVGPSVQPGAGGGETSEISTVKTGQPPFRFQ